MSIFLSSGEASGDHYTARLARAFRDAGYGGELWGMGGVESASAGVRTEWNGAKLQLLGLTEVISEIPSIYALGREMARRVIAEKPECVVVADSPDFHLRFVKWIREGGYSGKIYYISPPSVWAWRSGRVKDLREYTDECFPLFRFEHDYLTEHGCRSYWKGYPMLEEFSGDAIKQGLPPTLAGDDRIIAILPGSRRSEIKSLLPLFEESAARLASRGWRPIFSVAPGLNQTVREFMHERFAKSGVEFYEGPGRDLLAAARFAIGASGTVTVESLLLSCYMVVAYRLNALSALIGRFVIKTKTYAMANILAGAEMFPELIQERANVENIMKYSLDWLDGGDEKRAPMIEMMNKTRCQLGEPGAYESWAVRVLEAIA